MVREEIQRKMMRKRAERRTEGFEEKLERREGSKMEAKNVLGRNKKTAVKRKRIIVRVGERKN